MADQKIKLSTKPVVSPTNDDTMVGVDSAGNVRLFPFSAIAGGTYTAAPADASLVPAATSGSWTLTGNGGPVPTQGASGIVFAAANNLAAASFNVTLKDNTNYEVEIEIADYVSGSVRVLVYGATTNHLGATASRAANGIFTQTVTTNATGSLTNQVRIQATGTNGTNSFRIARITVKESSGTIYPVRPLAEKIREIECSLLDFDVDPAGNNDSTSGFTRAIAECDRRLRIPSGTFKVNNIEVNRSVEIIGDGREHSLIHITGSGNIHGMRIIGESSLGRSNLIRLKDFQLRYMGAGQTAAGTGPGQNNWSGIYIQRKVIMESVYVRDFTNDGIYFAPSDEAETGVAGTIDNAVFFARLVDVWSKDNGRDGCFVRRGANANNFSMCQFDRNGRYGLHQFTDGFGTYGNTYRDGQASYNSNIGWFFENGTDTQTSGLYAEWNGSPDNTNTNGYQNTLYDFHIGDNCTHSWFGIGVLFGNNLTEKLTHIRLPGFNSNSIQVWYGGRKLFGD